MLKSFLTSAVAIAVVAAVSAASAKTGSWQVGDDSYHLYASDLDMTSRAGRAELLRRVERIADRLCEKVAIAADRTACVADTVRGASLQPDGRMLAIALNERGDRAYAVR